MSSVFTKIINGELPGRFIYRDDTVAAFLDIEPLTYGHTLIVPVQEVDKWTDLAPNVWCEVNEVAQSIGRAVMEAFDAKRAGYVIAGFDVPHAHIHVFPTNTMADYDFSKVIKADETDPALMDEAAEKLRAIMDTNEAGYAY
jgi:bis(5'-nucleosyl)-tetraphosphatase (symmetrical)